MLQLVILFCCFILIHDLKNLYQENIYLTFNGLIPKLD